MQINVRGDKVTVTPAIKKYIEDKIAKLDKYFDNSDEIKASVLIKVKNKEQSIEVTVPTSKFTLRAEEINQDLYAAVDLVIDKLERQVRKNKTRLSEKYQSSALFEINLDNVEDLDDEDDLQIVRRKDIEMKPMDEEEAILQMDLINHDFFVFKNIDEECVSVLYKRKDGKFGIINVK